MEGEVGGSFGGDEGRDGESGGVIKGFDIVLIRKEFEVIYVRGKWWQANIGLNLVGRQIKYHHASCTMRAKAKLSKGLR